MSAQATTADPEQVVGNRSAPRGQCAICVFRPHCLPAQLADKDLAHFESQVRGQSHPVRSGQKVVREGDKVDSLYAIRKGSLKAVVNDANGATRIGHFHFPGSIAGLSELYQSRWSHTLIALDETWLCSIPHISINDTLRRNLVSLLAQRLHSQYQSHVALTPKNGSRKVAWFLIEFNALFASLGRSTEYFHLPMHYMDLADYLGMRHESVSRTLTQLQQAEVIYKSGKTLCILDVEALRRVLSTGAIERKRSL